MYQKNLTIIIILAMIVFGCGPSVSERLQINKDLVNQMTIAVNTADWETFDELLTPDFRRHCQATPDVQVSSRDEFKKLQKSFRVSMPDQKITNEILIAEGDKVATYSVYSGTQTGPMGDIPVTGKSVEFKFISILRIEEGRIAELWVEWDNLNMLTQLGLFPPPAPSGE